MQRLWLVFCGAVMQRTALVAAVFILSIASVSSAHHASQNTICALCIIKSVLRWWEARDQNFPAENEEEYSTGERVFL